MDSREKIWKPDSMKVGSTPLLTLIEELYASHEVQLLQKGKIALVVLTLLALPLRLENDYALGGVWYAALVVVLLTSLSVVVMVLFPFRRQWLHARELSNDDRQRLDEMGVKHGSFKTLGDLETLLI